MAKAIFLEKQRFNQWWVVGIIFLLTMSIGKLFYEELDKGGVDFSIGILIPILVLLLLLSVNLKTRIDEKGIHIKMFPFHIKEVHYLWEEISSIEVKKYSALWDYGGWGIRGFSSDKAFNIRGNIGVKVKLGNGKVRMIGTQKPEQARGAIENHFTKTP